MGKKYEEELVLLRSRQAARTEEIRKRLREFLVEGTMTGRSIYGPGILTEVSK